MNALSYDLIRAIRGPIMLITLGVLVLIDYFGHISFARRTWPVLLIVFGLMKLLEKAVPPPVYPTAPPPPYAGSPAVPPGGSTV